MEEEKKRKLKAIYSELRGYLAQAPEVEGGIYDLYEEPVWKQYNETVNQLSEISGKDYSRFCIEPSCSSTSGRYYMNIIVYKNNLGGLISRLREEYFSDEPDPLDEAPSTVIAQSQRQEQSVDIQMVIELADIINEKIGKYDEGSKEKGFLQKLKSLRTSISNTKQLLQTIFKLAKDCGLNMNEAFEIFAKTQ